MMKATVLAMFLAASAASAQTSPLYLSNWAEGNNQIFVVQGGSVIQTITRQAFSSEGAFIVGGDIRTTGTSGGTGYQYTLGGTYTGTTYSPLSSGNWYDGTTDGTSNYVASYATGRLVKTNLDYTGETTLMTISSGTLGVAYDGTDNTLWTTDLNTSSVRHYTMGGSEIGSFSFSGGSYALALDPADGTLWMPGYFEGGTLRQYSKTGTLMNTISVSGLGSGGFLAAEFAVPAPGSLALLGLGGLAAARRRRA